MKRGYIRLRPTLPSLDEQRAALKMGGIADVSETGPVYVDEAPKARSKGKVDLPERELVLKSLRLGAEDEVVVAEEGIIGLDADDTLRVLAIIAEKGAVLTVVASGKSYRWSPDLAQALDLVREGEHQRAKWRAAHARRVAKPRQKVLRGPAKEQAKADWFNTKFSGEEVAAKWEVGHRTLYHLFGPRGTPRFGGKQGRRK